MKLPLAGIMASLFAVAAYADDYTAGLEHLQRKAYRAAAASFERAARAGDARAEREHALMIYQGLGMPRDDARAIATLEHAAESGDVVAQVDLAILYENGLTVARDEQRSAKWWLAAANQGDRRAQFRAGEVLWRGDGIARDRAEALKWWTLAREQGEAEWMRATLESLREPPSQADWDEARRRARAWHEARDTPRR